MSDRSDNIQHHCLHSHSTVRSAVGLLHLEDMELAMSFELRTQLLKCTTTQQGNTKKPFLILASNRHEATVELLLRSMKMHIERALDSGSATHVVFDIKLVDK
jgi:hypothetical protein